MRFAICNELFEGWDFASVCQFVAGIGYEGLELAPFTLASQITELSPQRRSELRREAEETGLRIIGFHWLLAKTEGLHLTSPDESVRQRTADYLVELARACADLGGELLVHGSPKQRDLLPGVSRDQAFEYAADTFRRALPALADLGVRICIEPLTTAETNFINTCAEGQRLVELVGRPNFVLHLDVKAMASEDSPTPELIRRYGPLAGHFHANDTNLRGPGMGKVDFVPIFRALKDARYQRWVSVEVFDFSPGPERIARESFEYMQKCLQQLGP